MEQFSTGSGVSAVTIRGAQEGKLTGSEVNERKYFKYISDCQGRYEPALRQLIDAMMETGQIKPKTEYKIEWVGGFEINDVDKARVEHFHSQALKNESTWAKVNELRERDELEPLPDDDPRGDMIPGLQQTSKGGMSKDSPIYSKRMQEVAARFAREHPKSALAGKPVDQLLAAMLEREDSVAEICRTLHIAKETCYNWAREFDLLP